MLFRSDGSFGPAMRILDVEIDERQNFEISRHGEEDDYSMET
jgi:hypothetical protein